MKGLTTIFINVFVQYSMDKREVTHVDAKICYCFMLHNILTGAHLKIICLCLNIFFASTDVKKTSVEVPL